MTMHNIDPLTYIKAALARDFTAPQARRQPKAEPPTLIVTLSRDYGALGEAVAARLGDALGIPVYDRKEILDCMAKHAKTEPYHFQAYDEQSGGGLHGFLYSLVSGSAATLQEYRHYLGEALLDMTRHSCILIGRGAHLALVGKKVFRLRIVGSKAVCAQRVALELNLTSQEAEHKVEEVNHKRHKAVVDLFGENFERCSLDHADLFDLVINTDHIAADAAASLILLALREVGFIGEVLACKT